MSLGLVGRKIGMTRVFTDASAAAPSGAVSPGSDSRASATATAGRPRSIARGENGVTLVASTAR